LEWEPKPKTDASFFMHRNSTDVSSWRGARARTVSALRRRRTGDAARARPGGVATSNGRLSLRRGR
jgi:hypothetical protein